MKYIYVMLNLLLGGSFMISCTGLFELTKKEVIQNIEAWYLEQGETYTLKLNAGNTKVAITRYHPDRPEEEDNMLKITHKGMTIDLLFNKPVKEILMHKDSLQKYVNYLSVDRIYNNIAAHGWEIYPETPQSSLRGTGIQFTGAGESLSFHVNWSTYTVMGYKESNNCKEEQERQDASVSEDCLVAVDKQLALEITALNLAFE